MRNLNNEKGIALVTSLMLTLISLAIVMALLYLITWQTKQSAAHRRYRTAIEASYGGTEMIAKQVVPYIFANHTTAGLAAQLGFAGSLQTSGSLCWNTKLQTPTANWGTACGTNPTNPDASVMPDVTIPLQGTQNSTYNVFGKIVDTVPGNSDVSGYDLLDSGSGVTGTASGVAPKHNPALYRIEVQGQAASQPSSEKARLSVLYAY